MGQETLQAQHHWPQADRPFSTRLLKLDVANRPFLIDLPSCCTAAFPDVDLACAAMFAAQGPAAFFGRLVLTLGQFCASSTKC